MFHKQESSDDSTGRLASEHSGLPISRRSAMKGLAGAGLIGLVGVPATTGSAAAQTGSGTSFDVLEYGWHDIMYTPLPFNGNYNGWAVSVKTVSDGGVVVAGWQAFPEGSNASKRPFVRKYTDDGTLEWEHFHHEPFDTLYGNINWAATVDFVERPGGGFALLINERYMDQPWWAPYSVGILFLNADGTLDTDSNGDVTTSYVPYDYESAWGAGSFIGTSDGGFLFGGDFGVVKADSSGTEGWMADSLTGNDSTEHVQLVFGLVEHDGAYYGAGRTIGTPSAVAVKLALDGTQEWGYQYIDSTDSIVRHGWNRFSGIGVTSDEMLVVAGTVENNGQKAAMKIVFDVSGTADPVFVSGELVNAGSRLHTELNNVSPAADGGLYIAGLNVDNSLNGDGIITKVTPGGATEWTHVQLSMEDNHECLSFLDVAEPDFGIIASGYSKASGALTEPAIYGFEPLTSQIELSIDVKPGNGDEPDPINPNAKGNIPVAVYSTPDFDARTLDVDSLAFGPGGASVAHGGHVEDVDGDGLVDLMLHFSAEDAGFTDGDTEATLVGQTGDGTDAVGTDTVRIVGGKSRGNGRGQ